MSGYTDEYESWRQSRVHAEAQAANNPEAARRARVRAARAVSDRQPDTSPRERDES